MHLACAWGRKDVVELLVDRGADPTIRDLYGSVPLMDACVGGHVEVVRLLLGYDHAWTTIDAQDESGYVLSTSVMQPGSQ